MRRQFTHAIDVFPTILELVGVEAPEAIGGVEQRPVEGTSFAYLLPDDAADALSGIVDMGDAPSCSFCGSIMTRNGSCYRCMSCGSTSGCS